MACMPLPQQHPLSCMHELPLALDGLRFVPSQLRLSAPACLCIRVRAIGSPYGSLVREQQRTVILVCEQLDIVSPPLQKGGSFRFSLHKRHDVILIQAANIPRATLTVTFTAIASVRDFVGSPAGQPNQEQGLSSEEKMQALTPLGSADTDGKLKAGRKKTNRRKRRVYSTGADIQGLLDFLQTRMQFALMC